MKPYKPTWKTLNSHSVNDMVDYCLLRALSAKSDSFEVAKILLSKAFTPIRNKNRLNNGAEPYQALKSSLESIKGSLRYRDSDHRIFGRQQDEILETKSELDDYKMLVKRLSEMDFSSLDRQYCYIWIDVNSVTPEQAMVQASHATMVVGKELEAHHNPHEIFFQIVERPVGVSADDLAKIHPRLSFHHFVEPDLGNKIIASAIKPVPWYKRDDLKQYKLVSFK